ncbi:hypothetical protein KR084_008524, partial [Drosophila pseudotakahashii]
QLANEKGNCVLCAVAAERICQRCGDFYCSQVCQLKDWPRHRYICFPLPALVYPKSFSVYQSTEELSLEGACPVNSDKTVVKASPGPFPSLPPDLNHNKMCNASNIAPINKVPILPSPSVPIIPNNSGNKPKNKIYTPPPTIMPPSNCRVYIMGFKSANRCYIRDATESADRAFAQVCEKINTMGNEMPRMVKPRPFGFCLAFHNGTFHRAKVMNVFGNHSARLFLLDQGVVKSRSTSELREINEELFSLPCYSHLVQLKDVPNYPTSDDLFAFTSQFTGEMYAAIREKTPGCVQVELLHLNTKISVNAKIREFFAKNEVSENQNSLKNNVTPSLQNPPIGQQPTKNNQTIANPEVNNSQTQSQRAEIVAQELLKKLETEVKNSGDVFISKALIESATKDGTNGLEIDLVDEGLAKLEKPTTTNQEIKDTTETLSKPSDEEVKQFLTQCLPSDPSVPLELPKLKEKLDSLSIAKTNPQKNKIERAKFETLLNPPFELRRLSIDSKEGIDVFVVDSSKKDRGIFGAFDSTYACEFSTLHSRLSEITDSEPYKPVLKEYVLARFEGSWYRGRVEQIINTPHQQTMYRVMYLDYTNVEDITLMDIRRYPLDFTTPCTTNLCVIDEFPHKPNAAQISFLSDALKVHKLVHVDSVNYMNNIAIIKSRSLIQKLMSL